MRHLAKVGFSQSYTYFTWKNSRYELTEYVSRAGLRRRAASTSARTSSPTRPTSCTSTCSTAGRPAFEARLVLAATLVAELRHLLRLRELRERRRCAPGSEEYLDSEKYEIKQRALDGPLLPLVQRLNQIRRENPALQRLDEHDLPRDRERRADRLRQAVGGQHRDHRRQHRPAPDPGGPRRDPGAPRACRPCSRCATCSTTTASSGGWAATTCAWRPAIAPGARDDRCELTGDRVR